MIVPLTSPMIERTAMSLNAIAVTCVRQTLASCPARAPDCSRWDSSFVEFCSGELEERHGTHKLIQIEGPFGS